MDPAEIIKSSDRNQAIKIPPQLGQGHRCGLLFYYYYCWEQWEFEL